MSEQVTFIRKATIAGGSIVVTIPPELLEYLGIEVGMDIGLVGDRSKHGKFIGVWNVTGQTKKER